MSFAAKTLSPIMGCYCTHHNVAMFMWQHCYGHYMPLSPLPPPSPSSPSLLLSLTGRCPGLSSGPRGRQTLSWHRTPQLLSPSPPPSLSHHSHPHPSPSQSEWWLFLHGNREGSGGGVACNGCGLSDEVRSGQSGQASWQYLLYKICDE